MVGATHAASACEQPQVPGTEPLASDPRICSPGCCVAVGSPTREAGPVDWDTIRSGSFSGRLRTGGYSFRIWKPNAFDS